VVQIHSPRPFFCFCPSPKSTRAGKTSILCRRGAPRLIEMVCGTVRRPTRRQISAYPYIYTFNSLSSSSLVTVVQAPEPGM
jgi:hypothetical protein